MFVPASSVLNVDLLDSGFSVQDQACIKIVSSINNEDWHTSVSVKVCARTA